MRPTTGQRGLVERARGQVQSHPDRDHGEAEAVVVEALVAEEQRHHEGTDRQQTDRDGSGEGGDGKNGHADRAAELGAALARLEPCQVGEDRGLDRLEELERRAHDQQDVEHEPGEPRGEPSAPGAERDDQHAGVHQRLLGEHDRHDGDGEAAAVPERQIPGLLL